MLAILKVTFEKRRFLVALRVLKCFRILTPLRSRLVKTAVLSSSRHEAMSGSTVPSGYTDTETNVYVAVARNAERRRHAAG